MSSQEPTGWYVYQPYGTLEGKGNRLYGVAGVHHHAIIKGLTKEEAETVCLALATMPVQEAAAQEGGSAGRHRGGVCEEGSGTASPSSVVEQKNGGRS